MSWLRSFSLRRRIAALVAGAIFATVVVVALAAWTFTRHYLLEQTDANLVSQARSASQSGQLVNNNTLALNPTNIQALSLPYQLVDRSSVLGSSTVRLPFDPNTDGHVATAGGYSLRSVSVDGRRYRMITIQVPQTASALQVAQDISAQETSLHKLGVLLAFVVLAGAVGGAAAGVGVAGTGLRPVRLLTAAAERVARTDELEAPIALSGRESPDDEVARLASAFNDMIAALAMSRDRQRSLIADAGHELRTPLTSLRTNIELLAREDPGRGRVLDPDDRRKLLADLTAQTAELASLIGDLTDLAREDSAQAEPEDLDLADVATRAVDRVRRRDVTVRLVTELESSPVHGRPRQLERAVTNLLDNAVKWSPAGGEVFVGLHRGELVVADQGPGISDEDLPHVFERFYRATTSRDQPGSGLGLAIVAQAAHEHGGTVEAGRTPAGGTLMRLTVPLAAPPELAPFDLDPRTPEPAR